MQSLPLWAYILEENVTEVNRQNDFILLRAMKEANKRMRKQKGMGVGTYIKWETKQPEKSFWGSDIKLRPQG